MTPDTSYGFDVIEFASDVLERPLLPWQKWLVIHAGELTKDDGLPRFKEVLVTVGRQNGKTELLAILATYWLFVDRVNLVLGTSTNLGTAAESWEKVVDYTRETPELSPSVAPVGGVVRTNGKQTLKMKWGARYRIAAANRKGARGLTVDRLIMDELREHDDWSGYHAAVPTTQTVPDAQIWMLSNAGEDHSKLLNELRDQAIAGHDPSLGLFEWSGATDDPTDPENILAANPGIGHISDLEPLLNLGKRAKASGGDELAGFITERLCRRVALLNPAINLEAWAECRSDGGLDDLRDRVAMCLDVSMDELHATLYAAAVDGERVRVDVRAAWEGQSAISDMSADLPGIVESAKPKVLGWFPYGPAAAAAAALEKRRGWPPPGVKIEPIRGEVTAVCMGFAEQVRSKAIAHTGDPLLDAHVRAAEKLSHGDGWRFTRKGAGHVDAAYAAAGAVHLARTMKPNGVQLWV